MKYSSVLLLLAFAAAEAKMSTGLADHNVLRREEKTQKFVVEQRSTRASRRLDEIPEPGEAVEAEEEEEAAPEVVAGGGVVDPGTAEEEEAAEEDPPVVMPGGGEGEDPDTAEEEEAEEEDPPVVMPGSGEAGDPGAESIMLMSMMPFTTIRTDPIVSPNTLSDHVHTFYGPPLARPEVTFKDLRSAASSTANVKENNSLYWHNTIYRIDENGMHHVVNMGFASAYYHWIPVVTKAFPEGFKMIASSPSELIGRDTGCDPNSYGEPLDEECNDPATSPFFPTEATEELERFLIYPSCWNGVDLDTDDHRSHMAYPTTFKLDVEPESCPPGFPIKLPIVRFVIRILDYVPGSYIFSDGTQHLHGDFFSGWDPTELQRIMDNCIEMNHHDRWCEDQVGWKVKFQGFADFSEEVQILSSLLPATSFDTKTITDELVDGISELPRGAGIGTLFPLGNTGQPMTPAPQTAPTRAPTEPTIGEPQICFAGSSLVRTNDARELISMNDLKIGDQVMVDDMGTFETVYSFAHRQLDALAMFLEIGFAGDQAKDTKLTISPEHLVFLSNGSVVQASSLQEGDELFRLAPSTESNAAPVGIVTSIREVERRGIFAPFTKSGKIVVNDVVASCYVGFEGSGTMKGMFGLSYHTASHVSESLHRMWCGLINEKSCTEESYTNGGTSQWSAAMLMLYKFILERSHLVRAILTVASLTLLSVLRLAEIVLLESTGNLVFVTLFIALASFGGWCFSSKKKSQN